MEPSGLKSLVSYTKIYVAFMTVLYICLVVAVGLGGLMSVFDKNPTYKTSSRTTPEEYLLIMGCFSIFVIPFVLFHIYVWLKLHKPSKANYYLVLTLLVLGFQSIITLLPTIILFVKWLDQDVRKYYLSGGKVDQASQSPISPA